MTPGDLDYEKMVTYVSNTIAPLQKHVDDHDAWHRGRLDGAADARRIDKWQRIQNTIASVSVIVAAVALILKH